MLRNLAQSLALASLLMPGCANTVASGAGTGGSGGGGLTSSTSSSGESSCNAASSLALSLEVDGEVVSPGMDMTPTDLTFDGRVLPSTDGSIVINPCAPKFCTTNLVVLRAVAPSSPSPTIPVGALVRLRYYGIFVASAVASGGVAQHVYVQNLPTWFGKQNPISSTERVWFTAEAVTTGNFQVPAGIDPLSIGEVGSTCPPLPPSLQYAMTLEFPGAPKLVVDIGGEASIDATGPLSGHYTLRNFVDRADDTGNHRQYWIVGN